MSSQPSKRLQASGDLKAGSLTPGGGSDSNTIFGRGFTKDIKKSQDQNALNEVVNNPHLIGSYPRRHLQTLLVKALNRIDELERKLAMKFTTGET